MGSSSLEFSACWSAGLDFVSLEPLTRGKCLLLGKGITDQDRNILSNQVLILGFLRSAAKVLSLGPVPSFTSSKRKKKRSEDDDEEEDAALQVEVEENMADDGKYEFIVPDEVIQTRGTVLITLRNVAPYTLW